MDAAFAWALLGSTWAHIALAIATLFAPEPEPLSPPMIVEVVTVVAAREEPSPVEIDLPEAIEPEPAPEPEGEASPVIVEALGQAVEAARAATEAATSSAAALLGFAPLPPATPEPEGPDPEKRAATPRPVLGAAVPPERAPPPQVTPPQGLPDTEPPVREPPEVSDHEPPPPPAPPEAEPEPEPEEEVRRFVRSPEGEDASGAHSDVMSAVSRAANRPSSRTPVTSPIVGPLPSTVTAVTTSEAHRLQQTVSGGGELSKADVPIEEVAQPAEEKRAGGGGHDGTDGADSAATGARGQLAAEAGARVTSLATLASTSQGSTGTAEPSPSAPEGEEVPTSEGTPAPSWWQPAATRIVYVEPAPTVAPHPQTEVVVASRKLAPKPVVAPGGSEAEEEVVVVEEEPLPGLEAPEVAEAPTDDPYARPEQEAIEALREALGWGKLDRSSLAREGSQGNEASTGLPPGSPQTVTPHDPLADVVFVSVEATPLGKYTDDVYSILEDRWYGLDLDTHDKALGIQGDVGVVFRIGRNGKVYGIEVTRSSGNRALDKMATSAIPEQLPRLPRDVEASSVVQHVTFQYRNPWMSSSSVGMP